MRVKLAIDGYINLYCLPCGRQAVEPVIGVLQSNLEGISVYNLGVEYESITKFVIWPFSQTSMDIN